MFGFAEFLPGEFPSFFVSIVEITDEEEEKSEVQRKLLTHGAVLGRLAVNARISVSVFEVSYAASERRP
jgi:hypothetical protein